VGATEGIGENVSERGREREGRSDSDRGRGERDGKRESPTVRGESRGMWDAHSREEERERERGTQIERERQE
jgi:hypothetical protein